MRGATRSVRARLRRDPRRGRPGSVVWERPSARLRRVVLNPIFLDSFALVSRPIPPRSFTLPTRFRKAVAARSNRYADAQMTGFHNDVASGHGRATSRRSRIEFARKSVAEGWKGGDLGVSPSPAIVREAGRPRIWVLSKSAESPVQRCSTPI